MADRSPGLRIGILLAGCLAIAAPRLGYGATAPAPDEVPDAGTSAGQPAAVAEGKGGTRWRVPPIDYWGSLSYENRFDTGEQQPRTMHQLLTAKVNGSSYLWQPWFATVSGGLGISFARSDSGDTESGTRNVFLTGTGQAQFFPRSRFPFEAHFEVGDTRSGGDVITASDYRTLRVGVSQSYRPESGNYTLVGSYDHSAQSGPVFGSNTQDSVAAEYRTNWKDQSLQVNAYVNRAASESTGQETEFDALVARHNYGPSSTFTVDTTASVVRNRYDLLQGGSDTAGAQVSSLGVWRGTIRPLTVTGSARIAALRGSGNTGDSQDASAGIGASYQYNRNLQFSLSGRAGYQNSAGRRSTAHGENAGALYAGDSVSLAGYNYDWSVAANAGYQGGPAGNSALFSAQLNQALGRLYALPDGSALVGSVGANLGAVTGTVESDRTGNASGNVVQLGSNASLTWNKSAGAGSGYARASVSDARQLYGEKNTSLQLVNLQVSGTWNLSRYATLVGDLTYQYTRQDTGFLIASDVAVTAAPAGRLATRSTTANITYMHNRIFGVQRLRFVSQLQMTDAAVVQENMFGLPQDQVARWWDNRLQYLIGRLTTTLAVRVYEIQGTRRQGVYFRIERAFGSGATF